MATSSEVQEGSSFGVLLDKTNFYAESGGQENDTGSLTIDGKVDFEVTDVQVFNGYVLHIGLLKEGSLSVGDEVICTYSEVRNTVDRSYGIELILCTGATLASPQQPHCNAYPQLCPP